jgi:RNA polymerase sigma-70 factor, ECF subfamily
MSTRVEPEIDLQRFHAGERQTLTDVYRRHVGQVEGAVSCFCRGAEAECVVHEVFLRIVERPDVRRQFTGGDLGAWLSTIARRRAVDHLRRDRRWTLLDDPRSLEGQLPPLEEEEDLLHRDQLHHLDVALERFSAEVLPGLDARLAEVFCLRYQQHLSQIDAARRLELPRGTLIDREQRLMRELGRFLRRHLEGPARGGR